MKRLCLLALIACGPAVPDPPPASPASTQAKIAPVPSIATALKEDPNPSWPGLGDAGAPPEQGHHHHAH